MGRATRHSRRFHYYCDPTGVDGLLDGERDLLRESLLHLQPATEGFGDPGELREAEDELVGDVGDGNLQSVEYAIMKEGRG